MAKTLKEFQDEIEASLPEDSKNKAEKIRVNGAKAYLRSRLDEIEDKELVAGIVAAIGSGQRIGFPGVRVSPNKEKLAILVNKGTMTAIEAFTEFNKGPAEMRDLMKYGIRDMPAAERVWIKFDAGEYTVVAIGENAPEGWDGYMPLITDLKTAIATDSDAEAADSLAEEATESSDDSDEFDF